MTEVIGVRFRGGCKEYYFDPHGITVEPNQFVIVETAQGLEYAQCVSGNHEVEDDSVVQPLRPLVRVATENDDRTYAYNKTREKNAFEVCQKKIAERGLDMKLVRVESNFDGSKIIFFFTSDGRVDFRELVRDLAGVFRARIELRQIGVRDEAKMLGGLGICGRPFCCSQFLDDFVPVSIKMAKTQNLSLNPTKISGTCGRLMCCLKYEQEAYEDLLKTAPKNESFVDTPDGRGTVTEVNLLRQCVKVRMEESPDTIGCYKNCDICVLRSGKARKNDPPIPKDLAPISSKPRKVQPKEEGLFEPLPELIYPDQVSEFDQRSAFGAQNDLLSGRDIPLTPEVPEQPEPGDKPTGQNRRRRRGRGRGKGSDGAPEARAQGESSEKPAQKPDKQPGEPKREKRPNDQKPRPPRQNQERKPQGEKQPTDKPQGEKPEGAANGDAPKRPRRRRYRGNKPANGAPQAPKQGE